MSIFFRTTLALAVLVLSGTFLQAGEIEPGTPFAPSKYDAERYRHIWEKSPFVTEAPAALQQSAGLAQRFILTGAASLQDQPIIFVLDRTSLTRLMVTKEVNQQGLVLVSLKEEANPQKSQATIRLGSEEGVIRYDPAAVLSVNKASTAAASRSANDPGVAAAPSLPNRPSNDPGMVAPAGTATPPPAGARSVRRPRIQMNN